MKKFVSVLMIAVLLASFASCGLKTDTSTAAIPAEQYEALNEKYLQSALVAMIISNAWTDANELDPSYFINYFAGTLHQAGIEFTWDDEGFIPAGELEPYVQKRFDVSTEHLRSGEYYSAEKNAYEFGGLGSTVYSVVTGAEQKGKLLTIRYDIIGPMEYRVAYGTVEIEENGEEYKYRSNQLEWSAQSYLDYPNGMEETDSNGVFMLDSGGGITLGNPDLNIHEYSGKKLSDIIYYYENVALPKLEAQGSADMDKYEDGWYWSGTYRSGKPLTIDVRHRFGADTYIIAAVYEANAGTPDWERFNVVNLNELDALYGDYFGLPFYAGLFDSTWSVPFNVGDKGAFVRFYALMEGMYEESELRFPTADVDVFLERYFAEDDLDMIRYSIWYDEASNTYHSDKGFEQGGWAKLSSAKRDGDNLILFYEVYESDEMKALQWEGEVAITLSESGYKYASNTMRYPQYPITQDAAYLDEVTQKYIWWLAPYTGILQYSWTTPQDIKADNLVDICSANNLLNLKRENGDYIDHHGPAEQVEAAIQQHFEVSAEYLRTSSRYRENYTDEYNGEQYINEYLIGDGGGWGGAVALNTEQDGNLLKVTVGIYGPDDEPDRPRKTGLLTIRLNGESYQYLSYELE